MNSSVARAVLGTETGSGAAAFFSAGASTVEKACFALPTQASNSAGETAFTMIGMKAWPAPHSSEQNP